MLRVTLKVWQGCHYIFVYDVGGIIELNFYKLFLFSLMLISSQLMNFAVYYRIGTMVCIMDLNLEKIE